ncbi:MAG TPA: helix-turn-helix domain-containing protein [Acidimicrobiales bacterium]|nr:helix-turn-helix domain-containing protein [Acidimicrobiales bacterium]
MDDTGAPRTFAERLEHLFQTVHPEGRRPYSLEEVASGIVSQGYEPVSAAYIWALRKGQRENPTIRTVEALAGFFGVPAAYFFDDVLATKTDSELALLSQLRQAGGRSIAARAEDLTPQGMAAVESILELATQAVVKMIGVVADLDRSQACSSPTSERPGDATRSPVLEPGATRLEP